LRGVRRPSRPPTFVGSLPESWSRLLRPNYQPQGRDATIGNLVIDSEDEIADKRLTRHEDLPFETSAPSDIPLLGNMCGTSRAYGDNAREEFDWTIL
jgi:hypothetical protein